MKFRKLGATDLKVSEIGFSVWQISTNCPFKIPESLGISLLQKAYDLEINLYDTSDTYGRGYGEEIIATALGRKRHEIVISTKFTDEVESTPFQSWQGKQPQRSDPEFVRSSCERSLKRLNTDYIDIYQMHQPLMDTLEKDEVFETLESLVTEGKIRYFGFSFGSEMEWLKEATFSIKERNAAALQIVYNIREQEPANLIFPIASEAGTGIMIMNPHASGQLTDIHLTNMNSERNDSDIHPPHDNPEKTLEELRLLKEIAGNIDLTLSQLAIKFGLTALTVASVLPNITNLQDLAEFASVPYKGEIDSNSLKYIEELQI